MGRSLNAVAYAEKAVLSHQIPLAALAQRRLYYAAVPTADARGSQDGLPEPMPGGTSFLTN